jgi:hypothetical protein
VEIPLISDAGTPAISDPGFLLTRACVENGITVECLPGATAFVPALVNSGLPNDKFVLKDFFLKKRPTNRYLELEETRTIILYVSPHKLVKTLAEFITYFERIVKFVFQENCLNYTKKTEEVLLKKYSFRKTAPRGEIVVVVAGKEKEEKKVKKKRGRIKHEQSKGYYNWCWPIWLNASVCFEAKGIHALVLEANSRIGGRIETITGSTEVTIEMGATWFGKQHPTLTALLDELGIPYFKQHTKGISHLRLCPLFLLKFEIQMLRNLVRIQGGTATLIKKISC